MKRDCTQGPVERCDHRVSVAGVQKEVRNGQLVQKRRELGKCGAAGVGVVAEALHEAVATVTEQQQTEELHTTGGETMRVEDENARHLVTGKVVLQEIKLEDHGGNHEHSPLFVQCLSVLRTSRLIVSTIENRKTLDVISLGKRAASRVIDFSSASMRSLYSLDASHAQMSYVFHVEDKYDVMRCVALHRIVFDKSGKQLFFINKKKHVTSRYPHSRERTTRPSSTMRSRTACFKKSIAKFRVDLF